MLGGDFASGLIVTLAPRLRPEPASPCSCGAGPLVAKPTLSATAAATSATKPSANRRTHRTARLCLDLSASAVLLRAARSLGRSDRRGGVGGTRPRGSHQ